MNFLKESFDIKNVSADMADILNYPWSRIYTTNYDDAIETALDRNGRKYEVFNNTRPVPEKFDALPIVHLHGGAKEWDIENFSKSCVLTGESYLNTGDLKPWLDQFQSDVDRAQIIVFIGFSTEDLHLNQVLYNTSEIKSKTWFINRPTTQADIDQQMSQSRFGTPHYGGRSAFAQLLNKLTAEDAPAEPALISFERFRPAEADTDVPSPQSIEDLLIFGKIDEAQVARDAALEVSDYHILRTSLTKTLDHIADGKRIILLSGEICDGKSLFLVGLSYRLSVTRPIFHLVHAYADLTDEAARILAAYPNAVLIVENCFQLHTQRREHLARLVSGTDALLIMTARSISLEAESDQYDEMTNLADFASLPLASLDEREINALIDLADQIAAWRHLNIGNSHAAKFGFIEKKCQRSLPNFLLTLLKSQYVRDKYKEEFNKLGVLTANEKSAVITALYASRIGHDAPVSFLSNTHRVDAAGLIEKMSGRGNMSEMKLLRVRHGQVTTVPSIGAINLLRDFFGDADTVNSVVKVLEHLAEAGHYEDFENTMFQQMMRYSILRSVVEEQEQIDRFFNHVSKIHHCRDQILFWLQWHMAETDAARYLNAEKYLDEGYRRADAYEKSGRKVYNRVQLDDRKAKFLMHRLLAGKRAPVEQFRDIQEALMINQKIFRAPHVTKHPFETLAQIARAFTEAASQLEQSQVKILKTGLDATLTLASRKVTTVPEGHHQREARMALENAVSKVG